MNSEFIVAVHAMVFLHHKTGTISSEVLAQNICTNPVRVRRVMAKLKKAGLAETHEGRANGGYAYYKSKTVTLGDISRALDVQFADSSWHSGDRDNECMIASGMSDYMDSLYGKLNEMCSDYLNTITIADVEEYLKKKKDPVHTQNNAQDLLFHQSRW